MQKQILYCVNCHRISQGSLVTSSTVLTLTEMCVFLFKIAFYTPDALEHLP